MGLVLMCVHPTLCSSSKYTNRVVRTDLHRVLKDKRPERRTKMQIELKYTFSRVLRLKMI